MNLIRPCNRLPLIAEELIKYDFTLFKTLNDSSAEVLETGQC